MADAIVRLKLESQEYDAKLKRGIAQMGEMEKQVRRTGATFAYADKEELEFIKSLGEMGTQASSAKSKLREYSDAITSLTATYRALTDEERKSQFGKEMAASIDKLKVKAAQLQDIMSDTQREIQNLASDTNFTDGLNLMTRTIGSCAAAVTAWTGESKEMDKVIKDLAKIGTTVAAVDALTKAFQKQNLVLLKNPYVAAAAAIAALAVAIGKLIKKSQELSQVEKDLQEVQKKGRDDAAKEITRIQTLNNILHDNTRSMEDRNAALKEIKALVPEYHGALTTEGKLINDNADALNGYIANLQRAATAQAAFDKMTELQKKKLQQELDLRDKENKLKIEQARNKQAQGQVVYAGTEMTQVYTQQGENAAERAVKKVEADIRETKEEIKTLQDLVNASDLATITGKPTKTTNTKTSSGSGFKLTNPYEMPASGTLADLERQAAVVRESMGGASNAKEYKEMEDYLNTILEKIREIKGEGGNVELTFSESGLSELGKQIKEKLSNLEFGSGDYLIATNNLIDFNTLQTLLETAVKNGLDFDTEWFNSLFEDVKIGADVAPSTWQALIDEINAQLTALGIDPIQINFETGNLEETKTKVVEAVDEMGEAINRMSSTVGAIATLGNAFDDLKNIGEDLADAFSGEMDAWDALMAVFNSGIGIMETVIGVMEAINTLQELAGTLSDTRVMKQQAETTAVVTGKGEEMTAEVAETGVAATATGVDAGEAAAKAGKSVAGIPIVGPILAVAAIAAVLGAVLAAVSKAKSGTKGYATGGMVEGNSYSGDNIVARLNAGEGVLTAKGVENAAAMANNVGGQMVYVTGRVSGHDIVLAASNYEAQAGITSPFAAIVPIYN